VGRGSHESPDHPPLVRPCPSLPAPPLLRPSPGPSGSSSPEAREERGNTHPVIIMHHVGALQRGVGAARHGRRRGPAERPGSRPPREQRQRLDRPWGGDVLDVHRYRGPGLPDPAALGGRAAALGGRAAALGGRAWRPWGDGRGGPGGTGVAVLGGRAAVLGEFGGLRLPLPGDTWVDEEN
jgi:hypothetical protein